VFAGADPVPETEAKRRLQLTGKRVLLFFGFVREYKGLDVLLEAVQQLDPAEGHHLLVVGEFYDDRARYRAALDNLTQRGQLTLVDRYVPNEEIGLYFAAADLVAVPYLSATQSGVIQIAYGFGKPVVATAVGGIPEVVAEGRTGFLVPPGDAAAIADAVRRYFAAGDAAAFRREIARENRRYSWEAMVDTVERAHAAARGAAAP
jgi:glycosyltransferase involved in cell wall biosynthesis